MFHVPETKFAWEPYKIKTEDGWHLTLFRITGPKGVISAETEEHKEKSPILLHRLSAIDKLNSGLGPLLADRGYEVWIGASRGQLYSNKHDRDGEWSLEERWDFSFAEMGYYDMPAMLKKIYEVRGMKAVVMGYSMGAPEALYGLARR